MEDYFTKEYVDLVKNKKVQGLRPELKPGDYLLDEDGDVLLVCMAKDGYYFSFSGERLIFSSKDNVTYIPDDKFLDKEILKICAEKDYYYQVDYPNRSSICLVDASSFHPMSFASIFKDANSLIAKIKLLIALLERE